MVKCLVWDLDETLWRGTLAEGDEVRPLRRARELVEELDRRGILQSIASKNDHDQAWSALERFGLAEYFVLPQIGWGPKSAAVQAIADGLNFDVGTIAFVDDRPTERAEVAYHLPRVRCYDAVEDLPRLATLPEFTPAQVTADSARRRSMYQAGFRRTSAQERFTGSDEEFLRTLDLRMAISRAGESGLARVEELTLRTSQMNATGVHYSLGTLRELIADPRHEVLVATLEDRFGPHGAIGILLLERHREVWHLKLLATSCRVVSLGAGATIINWLIDQAARAGVHLLADFRSTPRNRMMEVAYRFSGFTDERCDCADTVPDARRPEGLVRLHLVPEQQRPSATAVRVSAPDLAQPVAEGA
ncbi:HAD-IIIC family phosphatase [Streptomyces sediminimaris]|uniref:HAD-IIIC family phosphatase n=1 Tax=Streptomyces sediminimaris TaxID=3383721 RepID=UPI003999C9B5